MRAAESNRRSPRRWLRAVGSALLAASLSGCVYMPGTASPIDQDKKRLAPQKAWQPVAIVFPHLVER